MDSRLSSHKFYFAPSFVGDHLYFSFLPSIVMVSFELLTSSMEGNLLPVTVQLRRDPQYCGVFPCFLTLNHLHLTSWKSERCCCVITGRHLTLASGFVTNEGSYVSSSSDIQFSYCWFQTMSFEQASSFTMLMSYWAFQPPTLSKGSDDIVLPV